MQERKLNQLYLTENGAISRKQKAIFPAFNHAATAITVRRHCVTNSSPLKNLIMCMMALTTVAV